MFGNPALLKYRLEMLKNKTIHIHRPPTLCDENEIHGFRPFFRIFLWFRRVQFFLVLDLRMEPRRFPLSGVLPRLHCRYGFLCDELDSSFFNQAANASLEVLACLISLGAVVLMPLNPVIQAENKNVIFLPPWTLNL
jgi:hypothetical protein